MSIDKIVYVGLSFIFLLASCSNSEDITPPAENEQETLEHHHSEDPEATRPVQDSQISPNKNIAPERSRFLLTKDQGLLSDNGVFRAFVTWAKPVRSQTYSTAHIIITTPDGEELQDIKLKNIDVWMKIHGHGLGNYEPELVPSAKHQGVFFLKNIFFIMPGPWEINLHVIAEGMEDKLEYKVEVLP